MYSQLILKRASAEGLARMAEMSAQDAYAYGKLWRKRNGTFRTEVAQCANKLIRRAIDNDCNAIACAAEADSRHGFGYYHVADYADEIIALRTWEDSFR